MKVLENNRYVLSGIIMLLGVPFMLSAILLVSWVMGGPIWLGIEGGRNLIDSYRFSLFEAVSTVVLVLITIHLLAFFTFMILMWAMDQPCIDNGRNNKGSWLLIAGAGIELTIYYIFSILLPWVENNNIPIF